MLESLRWARRVARFALRKGTGLNVQQLEGQLRSMQLSLQVITERLDALETQARKAGQTFDEPPPTLVDLVGGNYLTAGKVMFDNVLTLTKLRPTERVLDVGCGIGRTARHFVSFLHPSGRYDGFDIVSESIRWCQTHLSAAHPSFHFVHADIFNGLYNPAGTQTSSTFQFPYADGSIDVAFLDSVFTHMYPADVARYLRELRRVLAPGGRLLASFFLLDDEARQSMGKGSSDLNFSFHLDGCFTVDPRLPESAIGFGREEALRLVKEAGLRVSAPVVAGSWSGKASAMPGAQQQDLIVATRD